MMMMCDDDDDDGGDDDDDGDGVVLLSKNIYGRYKIFIVAQSLLGLSERRISCMGLTN